MADPHASVEIRAPIEQVWAVMVDTLSYGEWNPFIEKAVCALPPKIGEPIVLHVRWANGRTTTSPERITVVDPPTSRVAYDGRCWPTSTRGSPRSSAW